MDGGLGWIPRKRHVMSDGQVEPGEVRQGKARPDQFRGGGARCVVWTMACVSSGGDVSDLCVGVTLGSKGHPENQLPLSTFRGEAPVSNSRARQSLTGARRGL